MSWRRWLPAGRPPAQSPTPDPADATAADPWAAARDRMVRRQIEARGLTDPELLRVFRSVPRHAVVE